MTTRRTFLRSSVLSGAALGTAALGTGALVGCEDRQAKEAKKEPPPKEPDKPEGEPAPPPGPELPDGLSADDFIVHGTTPVNLEMRHEHFGTAFVTPTQWMFVRSNLPLPPASIVENPDAWEVQVDGVANARSFSVGELKQLGVETLTTVVQCSGNGRAWFQHGPSGSPWRAGAAANVVWTGVPVRVVVDALGGVVPGRPFVTATGGEPIPEGLDERQVVVERSVPADKGMKDCLLAWEMNGEPVPLSHGGPLRFVVPGYYGVNQIKHVKRVAFTEKETDAKIHRSGYRLRPIGEEGAPGQPSMWAMNVKSWITMPLADASLKAGPTQIVGVAFAGEDAIDGVEVTVDGGKSWKPATLFGPDLGPYAWRQFRFAFEATPGELVLASRARSKKGDVQPEARVQNQRGYGNNSWRDHSVRVRVT